MYITEAILAWVLVTPTKYITLANPNAKQLEMMMRLQLFFKSCLISLKSFLSMRINSKDTPPMKYLKKDSDNGPTEPCNSFTMISLKLQVNTAMIIIR